ncbi:MAG: hypothetical protein V1753_00370 [Pseudomonadota bacterium]
MLAGTATGLYALSPEGSSNDNQSATDSSNSSGGCFIVSAKTGAPILIKWFILFAILIVTVIAIMVKYKGNRFN